MILERTNTRIFDESHALFRDSIRALLDRVLVPNLQRFDDEGSVGRDFWLACGEAGLLCPNVRPEYGGPGLDFTYNAVIGEELAYAGHASTITLQNDVTAAYIQEFGSEEQKLKYLPPMVRGEIIAAIAMTEPNTGSDLQAIRTTAKREGNHFRLNGSKTYITNGPLADVVIVVAKTTPEGGSKGTSLILVDAETEGFVRGRSLKKIGQHSSGTSELFFEDVEVLAGNLIGEENRGFAYLMNQLPQERLSIAIACQASAQRAFDEAVAYTKERKAFGQTVFDFQNTRFALAALRTELQVGWAHLDWCIERYVRGELNAAEASAAKLWHSEMLGRVTDEALQLFGGAGYMQEYLVGRLWRDARVARIYGGTSEIMKEIISRSI